MPIFFTFTFLKVPAGLSLYIVSSNLLNIAQQYWLRRRYGSPTPGSQAQSEKDKDQKES
jgi:membrane protein insertase Oxa1/YidC/SpoIIIJ